MDYPNLGCDYGGIGSPVVPRTSFELWSGPKGGGLDQQSGAGLLIQQPGEEGISLRPVSMPDSDLSEVQPFPNQE